MAQAVAPTKPFVIEKIRTTLAAMSGATAIVAMGSLNAVDFAIGLQAFALLDADCGDQPSIVSDRPPGLPPVAVVNGPWGWPAGVLVILVSLSAFGISGAFVISKTKFFRRKKALARQSATAMRLSLAMIRVPSLTLTVAQLALQGISFEVGKVVSNPQPDIGLAVLNIALVALTVAASPVMLLTVARVRMYNVIAGAAHVPCLLRWSIASGVWAPYLIVGSFGSAFASARKSREAVGPLLTTLKPTALGVVAGIALPNAQQCEARQYGLAALCIVHGLLVVVLAPHRVAVLNAPVALSSLVVGAAFILKGQGKGSDLLSSTVLAGVIINVSGVLLILVAALTARWAARKHKKLSKTVNQSPLLAYPDNEKEDEASHVGRRPNGSIVGQPPTVSEQSNPLRQLCWTLVGLTLL